MRIVLKCDGRTNLVFTTRTPSFSWYCESNGEYGAFQISYRIMVLDMRKNVYWDTGRVAGEECLHITYGGKALLPHTRYFWNVEVETETGLYKSEDAFFVTGLSNEDWSARWITGKSENAPAFRKHFVLEHVEEAYAFVCGLGYFQLFINGKRVGDDYYVPNQTDYGDVQYCDLKYPFNGTTKKRVKYLGYEVSRYLQVGENRVEIWLGNGWYKQEDRKIEGLFQYGELKAIFQMHMGSHCITSDESWSVYDSPVICNNIFYGEIYDAGKQSKMMRVEVTEAPNADFVLQLSPADKVMESIVPEKVSGNVYDCKKVITGAVSIRCKGIRGGKITVRYAECLNESGGLDYKSTVGYEEGDSNQIQKDIYILSGEDEEEYVPRFVWHGFRFFEIEAENAELIHIKALYIYSAVDQTSSFTCSNALLNDIHNMYLNSQKTVLHGGVPMDCPHRERLGYTGDGQISCYSAMFNFDGYAFYKKWISDILDTQNDETGFVAHTAPFMGGGGGPAWGSAVAIVPWNHYLHYGDRSVIEKSLPKIEKWIQYLKNKRNDKGLVSREENGSWCLGDWCVPIGGEWSQPCFEKLKIPSELVNTCYYIKCIRIYQNILKILEMNTYDYMLELKTAIEDLNREYLGDYYSYGVQGCDVFPLHTGAVPEDCIEKVLENLKKNIENNQFAFDTGIFGTGYMLDVLSEYGLNNYAYKLMLQTEYPSYGNMLRRGATAVCETWEGTGSQTHGGLGCFDFWLHQGLVGVKPRMEGGFKTFDIMPYFADDLTYVKGSYLTSYGYIKVEWMREDSEIVLEITVPFNTIANLRIPGKDQKLICGKTTIRI